jgi:hypothetical protein
VLGNLLGSGRSGGPYQDDRTSAAALLGSDKALSPDRVGDRVVHAIRNSEFFIFTHSEPREWVSRRHQRIMAGFDALDRYQKQEKLA